MQKKDLNRKIARLESKHDHLETELHELDTLLVKSGFPKGIDSLKEVATSLLEEDNQQNDRGIL